MIVAPLNDSHDRSQFDCGELSLNNYLRQYASQHQRKGFGRTYVVTDADSAAIKGYYTITSGSVAFDLVPESVPRHPVPVVLLARLAVDRNAYGQGIGQLLLLDAMRRTLAVADQLGIYALAVEAIDEQARSFYKKHDFKELTDDALHLYLPLKLIRKLNL